MFNKTTPFFENMEQKIQLENIKISDYIKILKENKDENYITSVNNELLKKTSSNNNVFSDLSLFLLQKDLLTLQCRQVLAFFDYDEKKQEIYIKKIQDLQETISQKIKNGEQVQEVSHYESFIKWILSVDKYLGFSIDKENDLLYLVTATKEMINYYNAQKEQIEKTKQKK